MKVVKRILTVGPSSASEKKTKTKTETTKRSKDNNSESQKSKEKPPSKKKGKGDRGQGRADTRVVILDTDKQNCIVPKASGKNVPYEAVGLHQPRRHYHHEVALKKKNNK
ncbi:hypothetical protein RFI_19551 [Reticulomyxa filosa]|uniref:Uncharacterized protein n=1 Tax=Reticulomyxa filosa TaxID=46433 RepID=X6MV83_RETFI|nr:hypothetical protein RFI_19551 [Reticulomyxa filosa]|eukprot:ETO17764.1 hypothetical protein RFI_19551 [Reticulomyxa filosa]